MYYFGLNKTFILKQFYKLDGGAFVRKDDS